MSRLRVEQFEPVVVELHPGRLTHYGRRLIDWHRMGCDPLFEDWVQSGTPPIAGGASFSDYAENKILDHITGKTSYTAPSVALALCTVVPTDSSTGASITEANYTGYARLALAGSAWTAAASGETHNSAQQTFAACTSGSSTIIAWSLLDSATTGAGNAIMWGTATSTVISTTQTPPTIAASALSLTLD